MPFTRMAAGLSLAATEESKPQQFSLSHTDYLAFVGVPHPLKSSSGQPPKWTFDTVQVVKASLPTAASVLHVLGTRAHFTNPVLL